MLDKIKEYFEDKVFATTIRKNVKLSEAPSHGMPIITYAPDSNGTQDYMALTKEIIAQEKNTIKGVKVKQKAEIREHAFN